MPAVASTHLVEAGLAAPLGLVHGYGFSGAGSNLWTRSMARALCRIGRDVHVVCQEARPENFEFVNEAIAYDAEAGPRHLFSKETPYPGRCTIHRPDLEVLPTYVRPRKDSTYVRTILDLDADAIEDYVRRNAAVLSHVAREHRVVGFCVNHVVLSAVAAQRVKQEFGVRYAVLPHGSAIEYVVKKDDRMLRAATSALADADVVFALNGEMEQRLRDVFGSIPDLQERTRRLPIGVDSTQFRTVNRNERPRVIDELTRLVAGQPAGRMAAQKADLRAQLGPEMSDDELLLAAGEGTDYASEAPDADLAERLRSLDWARAPVVLYVGRLIAAKGIATAVLAFPEILARYPGARLVVTGTGALREAMEALVWALAGGHGTIVRRIVEIGTGFEDRSQQGEPFAHGRRFLERLEREGRWRDYLDTARRTMTPEHVLFTGFLDHEPLSHLYAVADVGVFPSVVREASPLVVPEAAASGTLPIGMDFGGMGDSLRTLAALLPEPARRLVTVRYDPEHTIPDMAENVVVALEQPGRWSRDLRHAAVEHYDWRAIASRLATDLAPDTG